MNDICFIKQPLPSYQFIKLERIPSFRFNVKHLRLRLSFPQAFHERARLLARFICIRTVEEIEHVDNLLDLITSFCYLYTTNGFGPTPPQGGGKRKNSRQKCFEFFL